jgi:hypothetical protein
VVEQVLRIVPLTEWATVYADPGVQMGDRGV